MIDGTHAWSCLPLWKSPLYLTLWYRQSWCIADRLKALLHGAWGSRFESRSSRYFLICWELLILSLFKNKALLSTFILKLPCGYNSGQIVTIRALTKIQLCTRSDNLKTRLGKNLVNSQNFTIYLLSPSMYSSSLSTHHWIHVLLCSKQCYSSSTPRPFSSCTVFDFTSSTDGKWVPFSTLFTLVYRKKSQGAKSVNMDDVQIFECIYWEETTRAKGRCELGHCPDAASRLCSSRDSASSSARFVALSLC